MASQRVRNEIAKAKAETERNWGGARAGAGKPKGVRVTMATRERIRGAMLIDKLEEFAQGAPHEPSQVTAALGLLKFQLPTLQATDITSGGEPLTIERTVFGVKT